MKIFVNAKPGSKKEYIKRLDDAHFEVAVREPPREGRANEAIVRAVAGYFNAPRASVRICWGYTSHKKVLEILRS